MAELIGVITLASSSQNILDRCQANRRGWKGRYRCVDVYCTILCI
jgi:hypothetical protein